MGKPEILKHWETMALRDWQSTQALFKDGQFIHALFFGHFVIENF